METVAVRTHTPSQQAYLLLHTVLTVAPILAGADKFFHLLTDWDKYVSPLLARLSPLPVHVLMLGVGVVEMIAGVIVLVRPRVGGWIVAAWLLGIVLNLVSIPAYLDVALRDLGLAAAAVALARLSAADR
jgi:hypothetical protein